ncbi:IclR family transcriptional regulator [Lactobacillus sp. ESL0677]|uniref:IclR family transcriptional regulator n=1 Tax=Lactobacillus sp. ESL0677 TaxID=2983208 RepID=UPI0023F9D0DE|nr:IclR family transcriptional regulator [Lactobacillus sp. ESL0677]WEV37306.1 IclR family transcriptional regulator [Lactobacillus sp. ESL0677]
MATKLYGTVLLKAQRIMNVLLNTSNGMTLDEISTKAVIPKPTVFKILKTLDYIGFVRKNHEGKRYSLGSRMIGYGNKALKSFDIVSISEPYLHELSKVTNETINLGVEENNHVTLLKKIDSPQTVNLNSHVGGAMELYSSAMGKALLATKSDHELDEYFSKIELKPLTKRTITSISELRKQISQVKVAGYALDAQENQDDVVCVGAAIQKYGKVFGAISVSTPQYRLDELLLDDLKKLIISTRNQIIEII